MNTFQKLLVTLFLFQASLFAASKTVFVPRSTTRDSVLELSQANYFFYHNEARCDEEYPWFYFFFNPFVQRSFNDKDLAKYFLKDNKSCLSIREDGLGDVNPEWLGLIAPAGSNFSSVFNVRPVRTAYGAYFNMYFDLCRFWEGLWLGIETAAMGVTHKLKPCETVTTGAENPVNNFGTIDNIRIFTDAINNPELCFGRFNKCKVSRGGLDDIQVKLGQNYFFREDDHIGLYLVANIPTGKMQRATYVFEPLVGSKHAGVGIGLNADFNLYGCDDHMLNWMFDLKYLYLFKANQLRLFDLCANGDWSRYLQVVQNSDTPMLTQPGTKFFTQCVKVTPKSEINFWTALHYEFCRYNFELGYNLWWRDCERVCQKCANPPVAIADLANFIACQGISASGANISQSVIGPNIAPTDSVFTNVGPFNIDSGTAPRVLTHKLYASFAYDYLICSYPAMVGITTACEFATGRNKRNALEQWQIFLTLGFTY
ncbi:hypothetical protein M1446_04810 [Candidatus Dependentiae bacterium]|nr:hypothetical protein [Candidatus Dependentiae bacterium]